MRFSHNPDAIACESIVARAGEGETEDPFAPEAGPDPFAPLSGPELGVDFRAWDLPCLGERAEPPRAMRPQRQHHLTSLAIRAFLDSKLSADADARSRASRYLREVLRLELPDAGFSP